MLEFLFGFGVGIVIGTKYNCKPYIEFVLHTVKNTLKDIKNDIHSPRRNNEKIVDKIINDELKKEI